MLRCTSDFYDSFSKLFGLLMDTKCVYLYQYKTIFRCAARRQHGMAEGLNGVLRKKCHVVRKKYHVVRKLFYVASIFGHRPSGPAAAAWHPFFPYPPTGEAWLKTTNRGETGVSSRFVRCRMACCGRAARLRPAVGAPRSRWLCRRRGLPGAWWPRPSPCPFPWPMWRPFRQ